MSKEYKPDFKIIESIDQCVWVTGSTNKETGKNEKPDYCAADCVGYNKRCDYYLPMEELEIKILADRYNPTKG